MRLWSKIAALCGFTAQAAAIQCEDDASRFDISEPPYANYFYSDCNSATQVVVTSPLPDSNLTIIGPRLLVSHFSTVSGLRLFSPQITTPRGCSLRI